MFASRNAYASLLQKFTRSRNIGLSKFGQYSIAKSFDRCETSLHRHLHAWNQNPCAMITACTLFAASWTRCNCMNGWICRHSMRKYRNSYIKECNSVFTNCQATKQGKLPSTNQSHCNMVMRQMTHLLHVGILNPCIAVCERRIQSHQALLLQAQDDKIEDQDTEC